MIGQKRMMLFKRLKRYVNSSKRKEVDTMNVVYTEIVTAADMLQSTIRIDELTQKMTQQQVQLAAITNSKLYGVLPFWHALKNAGLSPVIGLTLHVTVSQHRRQLIVYAKDVQGYGQLLKLSSASSLREHGDIPLKWLQGYRVGLKAMIPLCDATWLSDPKEDLATLKALWLEDCIAGVARPGGHKSIEETYYEELCSNLNLPIGATHRSTFLEEEDVLAFEIAQAIESGQKLNEREALEETARYQYVPTAQQLTEWFIDRPMWQTQIYDFLADCQLELPTVTFHMPKFPLAEAETAESRLKQQCEAGLVKRFGQITADYAERLRYELSTINKMGYADYFLIVADYIEYARKRGILTGPGRGSSASSLVAYAMRITDIDPLKYGLLFERFLNPERVTLPDIDVDFADHRRQEVIHYVAEKYGANYVSQIITFGTLSAKAVLRDVGRMFGLTMEELSHLSSLVPSKPGSTLKQALAESGLRQWREQSPQHDSIVSVALRLEGLPRNASTHAAGVVLSPEPLVETVPIEKGHEGLYLTQWPMQEVEQVGLLKMDFLGLRNLTTLEMIRNMIFADTRKTLKFEKIPLHDAKTFELLRRGDTLGVFQLESTGMREALREIAPTQFTDIIAINALYRPGPMDFIPVYARRKHGIETAEMPHEALRPILAETYGVIVYQEQILQIASRFAGFTMGEADLLRRAVSKKKRETLDQERAHFVKGALKQGFDQDIANNIYDLIVRFADYGFPKSHSAAYSVITYQMAYLKANFAPYFYAALLSSVLGDKDKTTAFMQEMKERGIKLLPPSITKSGKGFHVENGDVRFALGAIRGVPNAFLEELNYLRKNERATWTNLYAMAADFPAKQFKEAALEPLIKAGAFDEFGKDRAVLLASIKGAIAQATLQSDLADESEDFQDIALFGTPKYAKAEAMTEKQKLEYEKEVLGFYLSPHPIMSLKKSLSIDSVTTKDISYANADSHVQLIALIQSKKQIRTKKGEPMAFLQLEDEEGSISSTLFPRDYAAVMSWVEEEMTVIVRGKVERRNGKSQLIIKQIERILEV